MNWSIFNPADCTRLWRVDFSNWGGGRCVHAWTKKIALKVARREIDNWLFVDLVNEWTGESVRLKPLEPYPPPTIDEHGLIIDGPGKGQYF